MEKKYSRLPLGQCRRTKIKHKTSGCNSIEGLLELKKAEDCNDRVKTEDFNLDEMSTQAILAFMRIKSRNVRENVFTKIKAAIVTDTDPFTHKMLGFHSVTYPMVEDLIELVVTGKVAPKVKPLTIAPLTQDEITVLDELRKLALEKCKSETGKDAVVSLIKKLRGLKPISSSSQPIGQGQVSSQQQKGLA